jgi:hypothetical protein
VDGSGRWVSEGNKENQFEGTEKNDNKPYKAHRDSNLGSLKQKAGVLKLQRDARLFHTFQTECGVVVVSYNSPHGQALYYYPHIELLFIK